MRWIALALMLFSLNAFTVTQAQRSAVIGPLEYPAGINPLTGLPVADPAQLNRRPVLVKVSDYPETVRPQSGLNLADVVWEHLLAGGVTRFSAIYQTHDAPKVGPIRSGRLVDFELTRIYRSLFIYSGMAQGTIDILRGDGLVSSRAIGGIDPCPALCRFPRPGVALEHTLYGNIPALRELAVTRGRDVTPERVYGMAFSEAAPAAGIATDSVRVSYAETEIDWVYNQATGLWERSQDGVVQTDAEDGSPLAFANVIILDEIHVIQPVVEPGYWGPGDFAFSVNFIGEARIYLLRDGSYVEGRWRRASREEPLTFFDLDGNTLPLKPGNTWVNLVPRWVDGYQLSFFLTDAPQVSVAGTVGINMRVGPGDAYVSLDVAYPGDTFTLTGRNQAADWVQLFRPGQRTIWMQPENLNLDGYDILQLPIARPMNER
jgi:hypothetical protein